MSFLPSEPPPPQLTLHSAGALLLRHTRTMPDSQEQLWSDNPNGSKIPHGLYLEEKSYFVGILIASILYGTHNAPPPTHPLPTLILFARSFTGIIIVLIFQCMAGLFNSVRHGWKGVKWGLVSYTTIMFSFATVFTVATSILNPFPISITANSLVARERRPPDRLGISGLFAQWCSALSPTSRPS